MKTITLLMMEFETPTISIEDVAPKYFNINDQKTYKSRAKAHKLPIAFFRNEGSQKAGWLCHVGDLAQWIDTQRKAANDEFEKCNG
ncbi:MAG: pyocin activator PrtN family protein [Colwellia sp.]